MTDATEPKPASPDLTGQGAGDPVVDVVVRGVEEPAFVLHDHRRPRAHFDLRLEEGGVLRSWALPRGLPDDPARNRLAVAVPDHDFDHLTYTDETKFIADIGWWELERRDDRRFVFTLHGRATVRRYALIHTGGKNWLAHLTKEQPAD